jgi:tetraacyldisaccharide 4'-kinase
VRVVSDGRAVQCDWREAGDEAVLLAERLPGVPVVVGGDRVETGKLAVTRFRPDLILLDDGFQHRRLYRDADLVLLDATDPFGGGRLLPRGRLREPITGLRRAHACLVTRVDQGGNLEHLCRQVGRAAPGRPIGRAIFRPLWLRDLAAGREQPVRDLCGKRVLTVSGIANPHSFHRTVLDLGAVVVGELAFRDHHAFDAEDRLRMAETARQEGAEWIVTTEKDAVRLRTDLPKGYPVLAVAVGLEIVGGAEALEAALGVPVRGVGRG